MSKLTIFEHFISVEKSQAKTRVVFQARTQVKIFLLNWAPDDVVPTLTPPAVDVENPFETCLCEGQFFSNVNCTQAFFCNENVEENRGNLTVCPDGQIIRPNFLQDTVQCIDRVSEYQCPGSFNVQCAEDDIGTPDVSKCECDGQVL